MRDLGKTIEKHFAASVKGRVKIRCGYERARGSPRQSLRAFVYFDNDLLFGTNGTIACTGVLQTREDDGCRDEVHQQNLVEDRLIYEALQKYPELTIDAIFASNNYIIRALGFLDNRVGKTRLSKMNVKHEAFLVRRIFSIRCQCEGLPLVQSVHAITARKGAKYMRVRNEPDAEAQMKATLAERKRSKDVNSLIADLERGLTPNPAYGPVAQILGKRLKNQTNASLVSARSLNSSQFQQAGN